MEFYRRIKLGAIYMKWYLLIMRDVFFSPLIILPVLAVGFFFPANRRLRLVSIASLLWLLLLSSTTVGSLLLWPIEHRYTPVNLDDPQLSSRADAIVVLGGGRYPMAPEFGGKSNVSNTSLERARYAALLARKVHKSILVTGGSPSWAGVTEAALIKESLERDFLVPVKWIEDISNNTRENALLTAKILLPLGIKKLFLVTHAAHMSRAVRSFENMGFVVVPVPIGYLSSLIGKNGDDIFPTVNGLVLSRIAIHEYCGEIWYWIHRKITGV